GILRRAEKRRRALPPRLHEALLSLAGSGTTRIQTRSSSPSTMKTDQSHSTTKKIDALEPIQEQQIRLGSVKPRLSPLSTAAATPADSERSRESTLSSKTCAAAHGTELTVDKESEFAREAQATLSGRSSDMPSPSPCQAPIEESGTATIPTMSVRRLTPTECETLQGFPKGWTIPSCPKVSTPPATAPSGTP